MRSSLYSTLVRCFFAGAVVLAFVVSGMGKGPDFQPVDKSGDVPLVRAKYLAFYGTNRSDWATISSRKRSRWRPLRRTTASSRT